MWVRVLGSAAGGGFPQWNCACPSCSAARDGSRPCVPRLQSSIAVSADRHQWFLLNCSPDIQSQIESFEALHPVPGQGPRVQAVLLTDAELDHSLGLLLMREGRGVEVHATESAHGTLTSGTGILQTLQQYCPVVWTPVIPGVEAQLGAGLSYRAFNVPTAKPKRFAETTSYGRVVGYRVTDISTDRSFVYLPGVQKLTPGVLGEFQDCSAILLDGSFWRDDEMASLDLADKTSRDMGHVPISGPGGSLEALSALKIPRKIYVHINNTNPILLDDSPERLHLDRHGVEVAVDGLEFEI
ncbi:pyrroloquinoline quinone biosynthesis protein PqqB [Paenarthrobacter sp. AR 02]|uniref:pyrroloquinoline quinone biosynthesis protein PqqB n=1 Tax=Paenarthrobacter sp. AR 02 TaxID=2899821 RepID=UPI001F1BC047|nr:pyrroloquinoline quinone biosynthesis protein PqqB [Paenarthrobacter sp. AR 02]MCF3139523.1 pyrroloquinoline quinone biosynthesis protein PqqB [Paenarthrobacter sp. AR 02]